MPESDESRRVPLGVIVIGGLMVSAGIFRVSDEPAFRIIGVTLAAALVLGWLASPILGARSRRRNAEQYPEALKNYAIGETVIALDDFDRVCGVAIGWVELNGEKWKARCISDSVPTAKQRLIVVRRNGLTLDVCPQEDAT